MVPTEDAFRMARDAGLDLVEVSPNERPPVCKIMDYGKHKYLQSKRSKQKHHEQRIKEVRLRPKTDPHDKEIKLRRARTFLEEGHRVQFTMRFRGRERFHREIGLQTLAEIAELLEEIAKIERPAKVMGPRMTMVMAPVKVPTVRKASKPAPKKKGGGGPPKSPGDSAPSGDSAPPGGPAPSESKENVSSAAEEAVRTASE